VIRVKVLLVDDQELVQDGPARHLSAAQFGFDDRRASCADGSRGAGETVDALSPDVVLMDVRMPVGRRRPGHARPAPPRRQPAGARPDHLRR
jgi:DNA-binding NarL/FixJ family response regulator